MTTRFTRSDYMALPEGYPAQLIEGCLVKQPAPRYGHQRVVVKIAAQLCGILPDNRIAIAPADVPIDEFNVYQPDVCVMAQPVADDAADIGIPMIAIEILSPSMAKCDREVKRIRLLDAGVQEVWLLDPQRQTIEVYDQRRYRDTPRRVSGQASLASGVLPGLSLRPSELFPTP